jgi:imidazolonepropionase-like amidohydrolase
LKRLMIVLSSLAVTLLLVSGGLLAALQPPRLPVPEKNSWIFQDVTLVEAGRAPRPGSILEVENAFITAIGENSNDTGDASDLAGLFVSPGLTDLHVHYPPKIAIGNTELWSLLLLAHGVTSIRETGSVDGSIFAVREAIRDSQFPGPRIFACGAMLDGENPSFPSNRVVATPSEARRAVEDLAAEGADCIKAYNMLTPDALGAITLAAAEAGLPVIGHAPHSVPFEEAGLVDLQHGTGAVIVDQEHVGRSDFLASDWRTMDDQRIAYVARVSLDKDIAHTPTLVNARMRRLLTDDRQAEQLMSDDSGLRHLPRFWVGAWATIWGPPFSKGDPESKSRYEFFQTRQATMTVGLHNAGVRIHAGTDTLMPFVAPGSSLLGELDELVAAGIVPDDVWRIATREAGQSLGVSGVGTLDVGAPADLVFLRSNPAGNIAAFSEIEAVLADGRLYRRADFDAMLAAMDAHFHGALYSSVMDVAMALVRGMFAPDHDGTQTFGEES